MEKQINLDAIELKTGSHKSFAEGGCIMEIVSYIANEPWSDHPKCACPILTEYAIRMNDKFNDEHRQLLVILCGYENEIYESLGWAREARVSLADGARERKEFLWLNEASVAGHSQTKFNLTDFDQKSGEEK